MYTGHDEVYINLKKEKDIHTNPLVMKRGSTIGKKRTKLEQLTLTKME